MSLSWPVKDPDEVLDYTIDWTARLAGDTIAVSVWITPVGITKNSDTHTNNQTVIWLSGGSIGESYVFLNRITTAGLRVMDQSVRLKMKEK